MRGARVAVALGVGMLPLARFVEDDPWWGRIPDDVSHILVGRGTVVPVRWLSVRGYPMLAK